MTFAIGDAVKVRDAWQPGHMRTPTFVKGKAGTVSRVIGSFPNPEELAFGRSGLPAPALYEIRFRQADLWPAYEGAADDTLVIDLYHHWLEPA